MSVHWINPLYNDSVILTKTDGTKIELIVLHIQVLLVVLMVLRLLVLVAKNLKQNLMLVQLE